MNRYFITRADQDGQSEIRVGDWVVLDPTGRELLDCAEVGVVTAVDEDGATVRTNGEGVVGGVTNIFTVLR